jgi:2-dehydro-3-deoxygalactonokinase
LNKELILIDWGSTNFRALHLDDDGQVMDKLNNAKGISKISRDEMPILLNELVDKWHCSNIYACGMVGSSVGWQEVPYVACPATIHDIASAAKPVDFSGIQVKVIPGLKYQNEQGNWDVMRGEELQAVGWLMSQKREEGSTDICLMPGTHSKWVEIKDESINSFFTSMTGEIFATLKTHGLLRHHVTEDALPDEHFIEGVDAGLSQEGLGRKLFSIRGNCLLNGMTAAHASGFASGLLIGAEIADALLMYPNIKKSSRVNIIAAPELANLYAVALQHVNLESIVFDSHSICSSGFKAINELRNELINIDEVRGAQHEK